MNPDANSTAEQVAIHFARVWSGEVRQLVLDVQQQRQKYNRTLRSAEYGEDWSPSDQDLHERFCGRRVAEDHLVWAANQMDRWFSQLCTARGKEPPAADADLRKRAGHLDEAVFPDENTAAAGDNLKVNRSLRKLPDSQLNLGSTENEKRLFGLIDPKQLERRAIEIGRSVEVNDVDVWI